MQAAETRVCRYGTHRHLVVLRPMQVLPASSMIDEGLHREAREAGADSSSGEC